MKKKLVTLLVLIGAAHMSFAQQTAKRTYQNNSVGYLEYLPPGYESSAGDFPLLIYLHGGGEVGDGSPASLENVKSWGPPYLIDGGVDMCFTVDGTKQCFIVLSPQLNVNESTWPLTVSQIMDHIFNGPDEYKVDRDRIYITGMSRGGLGTYEYATSLFNDPNRIAAIAPIAAWTEDPAGCVISKRKIAVWAFHGTLDTVVPYSRGLSAFNNIQHCTRPEPVVELKFTTYPDRYHDAWIPAYDPGSDVQSPNLYEWLLRQKWQEPDPVVTGLTAEAMTEIAVYPNPASDRISILFSKKPRRNANVRIFNLQGQCVMADEYEPHAVIDVSELPSGIYILKATAEFGKMATHRFIK